MEQVEVVRLQGREQEEAPSTPSAAGRAEQASDPESIGARHRTRRKSGLRMPGRRGLAAAEKSAAAAGVAYDNAAGVGADGAVAAEHDLNGGSGSRRPSAGRRFGALLRRGAPTLNTLRSYRSGSAAKNPDPKAIAEFTLPDLGMSPPLQLEDPPDGHCSRHDNRVGRGGTEAAKGIAEGRRRFYRSKSSRDVSGHDGQGGGNGDSRAGLASPGDGPLDSSGEGPAVTLRPKRVSTKFARKNRRKSLADEGEGGDGEGDGDLVAFRSGSELTKRGGSNNAASGALPLSGSPVPSPTTAAAVAAAFMGCHTPPPRGPVSTAALPHGGTAADGGVGGVAATTDDAWDRGGAVAPGTGHARFVSDGSVDNDKESTRRSSRQGVCAPGLSVRRITDPGGAQRPTLTKSGQRCILDGYMSAPEVWSDAAAVHIATKEVDECIARAEATLFASETTSDSGQDRASQSSGGGEAGTHSPLGRSNAAAALAAATTAAAASADTLVVPNPAAAAAAAAAVGAGGGHGATSRRRKFSELLGFRRRTVSGAGRHPRASSFSGLDGEVDAYAAHGGRVVRNGSNHSIHISVGTTLNAAATGEGTSSASSSSAFPRRHAFNRSNSTSALDRVGRRPELQQEEEKRSFNARQAVAAAAAAAGRVASVSPERHRRHRDSFLEAGKDKLRRGRSKLSRGAFRGRSSSQKRLQTSARDAQLESPAGQQGVGEAALVDEEDAGGVEREAGSTGGTDGGAQQPIKQGPPTKPQLGTTYAKWPDVETPPPNWDAAAGGPWNTWRVGSASQFNVRTKGYGRTKVKAPSAPELYELVSIDTYRSPAGRICGVYPLFSPPAGIEAVVSAAAAAAVEVNGSHAQAHVRGGFAERRATEAEGSAEGAGQAMTAVAATSGAGGSTDAAAAGRGHDPAWGDEKDQACRAQGGNGSTGHPDIPPVLVVNCQLPDVPTPFTVQGDGPTVHVIFTFRATRRLCGYAARVWAEEQGAAAANTTAGASETAPAEVAAGEAVASGGGGGANGNRVVSGGLLPRGGREGAGESGQGSGYPGVGAGDEGGAEGGGGNVPASVRLLVEWMRRANDDGNMRGRFKAIGDIVNADEVGLPSIARRFSGKPILIYGKESTMIRGKGFAELDINAHAFSYVGRKGLYVTLDKWKSAVFRIGFLLEGRTEEEQPEHILGCGVFHGLDIYSLNELALSSDGERLVVTKPVESVMAAKSGATGGDGNSNGIDNVSGSGGAVARMPALARHPSSSSSSSATATPPQGLPSGLSTATTGGSSSASTSSSSPPSSAVPLVPRRHMALLLRSVGIKVGDRGYSHIDASTTASTTMPEAQACFADRTADAVVPRRGEDDMTVTAVAAAAFAGGWFCALLAVVTTICWSELSSRTGEGLDSRGGGVGPGGGPWPTGFSAWLVRVFAEP